MVSTRKSPQKTRPTGVPTLSGQARVRAERAEQRNEHRSAAARANAPVEEAHRPIEEEEVSQLDIVDDDDVYQHGNDDRTTVLLFQSSFIRMSCMRSRV